MHGTCSIKTYMSLESHLAEMLRYWLYWNVLTYLVIVLVQFGIFMWCLHAWKCTSAHCLQQPNNMQLNIFMKRMREGTVRFVIYWIGCKLNLILMHDVVCIKSVPEPSGWEKLFSENYVAWNLEPHWVLLGTLAWKLFSSTVINLEAIPAIKCNF